MLSPLFVLRIGLVKCTQRPYIKYTPSVPRLHRSKSQTIFTFFSRLVQLIALFSSSVPAPLAFIIYIFVFAIVFGFGLVCF